MCVEAGYLLTEQHILDIFDKAGDDVEGDVRAIRKVYTSDAAGKRLVRTGSATSLGSI